ncbi:MAG: B12-binding domain-containing protein [Phycisphaeraceae bacterium]|nr:B12-binding domain-containing protein [Phycisphaeraceae bacterium]
MTSRRNVLHDRFFNAAISGDRPAARQIIDEAIEADCSAEQILSQLIWPALENIQNLHRHDQLSRLAHHFATRLIRQLVDQLQMRLERKPQRGSKVLVVSGDEDSEELAAQIGADLLEADGYSVHYAGGGIANDEIIAQIADAGIEKLVIFAVIPATVPQTRLLIDRLHEIGAAPRIQIIVGGGVFNRADGLAEEIGADLWAHDPAELVDVINEQSDRRMTAEQRTVGRKRRLKRDEAA